MNKWIAIAGLVVLALIVCWHLTARSTATVDADPDMIKSPPEAQRLVEELTRPEYLNLSKEEAIKLLRARGFDLESPPQQEQRP
ncbi:MAG TPA: hypothetical protein VMV94_20685 [Phycisphaerae bacterium]|nr:hypothetical protein [Phycisphaerae bacterium]